VWYTCNPSTQEAERQEDQEFHAGLGYIERHYGGGGGSLRMEAEVKLMSFKDRRWGHKLRNIGRPWKPEQVRK
jgi:hypothetical protein